MSIKFTGLPAAATIIDDLIVSASQNVSTTPESVKVTLPFTTDVSNNLEVKVGAKFPTTGGTPAVLSDYETGTFPVTWTGAFTNPEDQTVSFTRIGNLVSLTIGFINKPQNTAANATTAVGAIPARLQFGNVAMLMVCVSDNGALFPGIIRVITDGRLIIEKEGFLPFSGVGNLNWEAFTFTYPL